MNTDTVACASAFSGRHSEAAAKNKRCSVAQILIDILESFCFLAAASECALSAQATGARVLGVFASWRLSYITDRKCGIQKGYMPQTRGKGEIVRLSQFLSIVVEHANMWLVALDETMEVVIWNQAAARMSGYSAEEMIGHNRFFDILFPDDTYRRQIEEKAASVIQGGRADDFETVITTKDGRQRTISWYGRGLPILRVSKLVQWDWASTSQIIKKQNKNSNRPYHFFVRL